ncbi:MAG TPA: SDR family NAD(P)-dependent oxidoreductase, partial [Prosthecobacter sp.]|nr:SDR family NAD(P)-dependent oxidoreductase [Prosthecobacter sp.]
MNATYDVRGLSVLVMGGTTGLGLAAARALARQGARVVVTSRSEENVRRVKPCFHGFGAQSGPPTRTLADTPHTYHA